jgi:peptidyl-prolyl cis-trans isomerase B (cyclophilin B)
MMVMYSSSLNAQLTFEIAQIKTNYGEVLFWMYPQTVNHKKSFTKLANEEYWDTLTFNRVIDNFVAQGGCPDTEEGFSESPYLLEPEFFPEIRHIYGAVGAGRDDNPGKLSAGCQFYIVQRKEGLPRLDDNYTIFGQVIKGMDVIDTIVSVQTDDSYQPVKDINLDINIIEMSKEQIEKLGFIIP